MDPNHRLFTAGETSVSSLRGTLRPAIYTWTTPKVSKRGDLAVIYGKRPLKAFVAVARQCSKAVESKKRPGQWFAYFQMQPLGRDVARDAAQARKGLADWGLLRNLQGVPKHIPPERRAALYGLLAGRNANLRMRFRRWSDGGGRYPPSDEMDLGYLRRLDWEAPPGDGLPEDHERALSEDIAERLVKSKWGRYIEDEDVLSSISLEYYLPWRGRKLYADIVLVSLKHARPTLLLIEVKWYAESSPGRNPVPQVLKNQKALLWNAPGWRVKPLVAATEYQPAVIDEARRARVEALRYSVDHDRLTLA